jgi:ankyrin repeat protein
MISFPFACRSASASSRMSSLDEFARAIEYGNSSLIESLISNGSVDINARLPRDYRPPALVLAAACGKKDSVDILLRANAQVNETDLRGQTACHVAALGGHRDVLALLLARQPNLAIVDVFKDTALCCATRAGLSDGARSALMLLEAGSSLESVRHDLLCHFASQSTAAIQALINRGVVVREIVGRNGVTPLHYAACFTRDADLFDMLINVCDLDARDCHGLTSVSVAAFHCNVDTLGWLIEAGADVNAADNNGATPLHRANNFDCAVLLLAAGANVCACDNEGRTALHNFAAREVRNLTAVHALLAAGADLDVADNAGATARQVLARRGWTIDPDQVEAARRDIAKTRIDLVRCRALQVCIGLQSLELETRCIANVRNPEVCVPWWPCCASHSVSHLVEDCERRCCCVGAEMFHAHSDR